MTAAHLATPVEIRNAELANLHVRSMLARFGP